MASCQDHNEAALPDDVGPTKTVADLLCIMGNMPMPVVLYELDEAETLRFVSASYTQAFGFTLSDIPSVSIWFERTCPDPVQRCEMMRLWRTGVAMRRATGVSQPPREVRFQDSLGVQKTALVGFSVHENMVIVTVQDITAMRQAKAALAAERESAARSLTENMPAGAYTMIQDIGERVPRFSFVSNRFLSMLDMTRAEVKQDKMLWLSRIHPDDHLRWAEMVSADHDRTLPFSFETRLVVKGVTRWVRAESRSRTLSDGATLWEGVLVDVTRLKETEERLKAVITASGAMSWHVDLQTGHMQFDENWTKTHGYPPDRAELNLADWMSDLHPDDVPKVMQGLEKLKSGAVEQIYIKYRRRHRNGHWLWFQVHAGVSARDGSGKPTMLSGVSFDITAETAQRERELEEKWLLREELQRAQQRDTVAQIAGKVAHDLNNMMAVISGTTEMLKHQSNAQAEVLAGLDRIGRSVDIAQDLVDGLGGVVRPSQTRSPQDLGSMIANALEMLGTRRIMRNSITIDLPPSAVSVWGSPTELSQVIMNLAINACESGASDRPATVTMSVMPSGTAMPERFPDAGGPIFSDLPMVLFCITDTGVGIAPDVRSRIFRPYFTTKGIEGTGLGLPIVASILHDNQAALWVDTIPGKGTTMTVAWPAIEPEAETVSTGMTRAGLSSSEVTPELLRLDGLNVLVVDDVSDVGAVLADMLEAAGAVSISETNPEHARLTLAEAPHVWSVLVTDLHMAGLDGRELARFAASLDPPVPVVLVTARTETLPEGERSLFSYVLSKPVSSAKLVSAVRSAAGLTA